MPLQAVRSASAAGRPDRVAASAITKAAVLADKSNGQIGQMLDVPLSDLVQGDNTLEFLTVKVPQNYAPLVSNIDLVLTTR